MNKYLKIKFYLRYLFKSLVSKSFFVNQTFDLRSSKNSLTLILTIKYIDFVCFINSYMYRILSSATWCSSKDIVSRCVFIGLCSKSLLILIVGTRVIYRKLVVLVLLWEIVEFAYKNEFLLVLLFFRIIKIDVIGNNDVMKKVEYLRYPNPMWIDFKW